MKRGFAGTILALVAIGLAATAAAQTGQKRDPARELASAKRLACAFTSGVQAAYTPKGGVSIKPPLNPNAPGLTLDIVDREAKKVLLEEDDRETAGVYMTTQAGLTAMARYPDGGVTVVTVYPLYSGVSDNYLMVSSHHGIGAMPQISQRYGLCRLATDPPPAAPALPKAPEEHGAHKK